MRISEANANGNLDRGDILISLKKNPGRVGITISRRWTFYFMQTPYMSHFCFHIFRKIIIVLIGTAYQRISCDQRL